jgi:hypothetical protein
LNKRTFEQANILPLNAKQLNLEREALNLERRRQLNAKHCTSTGSVAGTLNAKQLNLEREAIEP